jgi:hypothetical protein
VVFLVGRGQHLGFVNEIHLQGFQDAGFGSVANAALGHHRDGHRLHDLLDLLNGSHARHAALGADVGGDPLQGHHRHRPRVFRNPGLGGVGDVHDHPAFEHFRQAHLHPKLR